MAKITGIGGIFFKSANKGSELAEWYKANLGLDLESWGGSILRWTDDKVVDGGLTVWSTADHDTKWFSPSESSFMINYRVDNLDELLASLKQNGVEIQKGPDSEVNGKFAWIMDPDGNKLELWEPMVMDEKNKA
jgi:predicted enzyme related to lactoylglutathione lyase